MISILQKKTRLYSFVFFNRQKRRVFFLYSGAVGDWRLVEAIGSSHTGREVPAVHLGCPWVPPTSNTSLRPLTTAPDTNRAHKSHGFSMIFIDFPLIFIDFSLIFNDFH